MTWFYQLSRCYKLAHVQFLKLKFQGLALCQSMQRNCELCVVYTQKDGAALLVGILKHNKHKDKLVERKVSMDTLGIKSAKLQDKFFFESFMAFQTA